MPRTDEQNQAIRDKRKTKITAAGIKLISIYGLNNVVVDDIAKEVGCSHGLFYHYYTKTEDLYAEIPTFILENKKICAYSAKYEPMAAMSPAGVINLIAKNLEELPAYPSLVLHTAHIVFASKQSLKDFGYYDFCIKTIEEGQKEGTIKDGDPEAMMSLFIDTVGGYISRCIREGREASPIPAKLLAGSFLK